MRFSEILAGIIRATLSRAGISSHERVLLQRYSTAEASPVVDCLLKTDGVSVEIGLPEDTGHLTSLHLPATRISDDSRTIDLIPFVVTDDPAPGDPPWRGSQGFASRLRTSFHLLAPDDVIRVLILFDGRPVETEKTTASEGLAEAIDSLDSLLEWFRGPRWTSGFSPDVFSASTDVLAWWRDRLTEDPRWFIEPRHRLFERAADFLEHCQPCGSPSEIGEHLPRLGLLFRDPALLSERDLSRLDRNANLGALLDALRRQRLLDPLVEADAHLDLGSPGDAFYDEIAAALRASDFITEAPLTLSDVEDHLRSRERRPAWLDYPKMKCLRLDGDGRPGEPDLEWRLLADVAPPPETEGPVEIIVPCPSDKVRITIPVAGDLRAFLFRDGVFLEVEGDDEGALRPGSALTLDFDHPASFSVTELVLRERRPGRGRPPRPTQILRVGVVAGPHAVIPQDATLDAEQDAFVVDGAADFITVQVGPTEIRVDADLPPTDGSPAEVEIGDVRFRWAGEDRSPPTDHDAAPKRRLRLLELLGLRQVGDPTVGQPYYLDSGALGVNFRTNASLDVPEMWMRDEAALLSAPQEFVGITEDTAAAEAELHRLVPSPFDAWIDSRLAFFEAVTAGCERRLPQMGADRPSVYLADLRDPMLSTLAAEYVDRYTDLLEAISIHAGPNANRALVEPVLLCDRVAATGDSLRIAPTHPAAVALLATLQRGLLSSQWPSDADRNAIEVLLKRPLLNGVLPWVPWRGQTLSALAHVPILWRAYGTDGGTLDPSSELGPVVVQKVKRLLSLAPHLNQENQTVFINVEIGKGQGEYLVDALAELEQDKQVRCVFDVGVVCSPEDAPPAIALLFSGGVPPVDDSLRDRLHGFVRVRRLRGAADRAAHLVFRMEAARATKEPFASMSRFHPLARDTGFSGGLSHEPARFADSTPNEVVYTRYLAPWHPVDAAGTSQTDGLWDGAWRDRYGRVCNATRHTAVGLQSAIADDAIPCQALRQIADGHAAADYDGSFITVHCDPAQGPEFFVGARTERSGVFLVECSDRGSPQLPGRDIVAVTSRIGPFRAALAAAVSTLPKPLDDIIDDSVAKGLLRDINLLRGTEVFDFLREISQQNHVHFMDGLDNVLALRFLLSERGSIPGHLPVVVALRDLTSRSGQLSSLRSGSNRCDDILVLYVPRTHDDSLVLRYRLIEVKFGERKQGWSKAQRQISETADKLSHHLPATVWREHPSPTALLIERDLAWAIHEVLERYRAFGLLLPDAEMEAEWGLREVFRRMHQGAFTLTPYSAEVASAVNGTALMLDPTIPGGDIEEKVENDTEYVTLPRDVIKSLLATEVPGIAGLTAHPRPADSQSGTGEPSGPRTSEERSLDACPPASIDAASSSDQEESATQAHSPSTHSAPQQGTDSGASGEASQAQSLDQGVPGTPAPRDSSEPAPSAVSEAQREIDAVFAGFVGNGGPVTRLKRALAIANLEGKRWLEPIGLFGPKSTGKTELARRIASVLDLPQIELSETLLRSADDLATAIRDTAHDAGRPLRIHTDGHGATVLRAPPMVVFIDEVHLLRAKVQESLLKALEPDDRKLLSTIGTIDTEHVTFIIATTDPGDLGEAFKSRVSRFELREYTLDELVEILKAHREHRTDLPSEVQQFNDDCLRIFSRVGRQVPRQAIRLMKDASREVSVRLLTASPTALREHYWNLFRADDLGLTDRDRKYLRLLFPDQVVGLDSLSAQLGLGKSTVSADIEPYLLRLGLVERARGGRSLTYKGRELVPTLAE